MNRPIIRIDVESIKNKNKQTKKQFPAKESSVPDDLTGELYHTRKEEAVPVLLKLIQNIEEEGTLLRIPKPKTSPKKFKKQANIFDKYRCKNSQQNISKLNPTSH